MDYKEIYKSKLLSIDDAVKTFSSNWVLGTDIATGAANGLAFALCDYAKIAGLKNIKIHTMLDVYPYPFYVDPSFNGIINGVSWFSGGSAKKAVGAGYAEYIPNYYRDVPKLVREYYDYDAAILSVSPMDENGDFTMGAVSSYTDSILDKSKRIYVEVNKYQPYAVNGTKINVKDVYAIVENDTQLPVLPAANLDETSITIGNLIAEQIPDGACIQLGIGAIPDAVGNALKSKHDLGIHTEMFTDSMVELINCGAVNNSKKQIHTGKSVTTFAFGSQRIYDYINNNPDMILMPVDYVNDPNVICQNDNVMSINACVEVDFWGQVCSESIGPKHLSGSGGQVDYVRGATQSKGGKSFIAITSTAKGGTISKIVPSLATGAAVTTSKNDVDYIVTEYGIAQMRGQSVATRVKNLIAIAHPNFRDQLTFEAKSRGLII